MKELSLHILDIVQNSVRAQASLIEIEIIEDSKKDRIEINISDNGKGMDEDAVKKIYDPFFTTRTTRDVGLGIPLLVQAAKNSEGDLSINSKVGKGTTVKATFVKSHIDRAPIGNMSDTMISLILPNPKIDFIYRHIVNDKIFLLDTREIKRRLQDIPITHPSVLNWINKFINNGLKQINGGV